MTSALKTFIVREDLRAAHAERFMVYMDKYNAEVFLDLKKHAQEEWKDAIDDLSKAYVPSEQTIQDAQLKNPKATVKLEMVTSADKIVTSRSSTPLEVSPSVKVPLIYSKDERRLFVKRLLVAGVKAMNKTVQDWGEIFT